MPPGQSRSLAVGSGCGRCTLLAAGPGRRRAALGGAVHPSHRVIQTTAEPRLGEGRGPCTHTALLLGTPSPVGSWDPGC